ncbi:MAG: DNA polymerase [Solirubrobacterales bacterium]|nr:DNA polymerase [Solirubrobacterales bacterium]
MCRDIATAQREVPVDLVPGDAPAGPPDAGLLQETFRRWELKEPLRRIEKFLGVEPAVVEQPEPQAAAPTALNIRPSVSEGTVSDALMLGEGPLAIAICGDEVPEDALFGDDSGLRFAATVDGKSVVSGAVNDASELVLALGDRPVVAHDAKAMESVPAVLEHDTMIAAHLLDPARRGYDLAELAAEAGISVKSDDPAVVACVRAAALAEIQRPRIDELGMKELFGEVELPTIGVLRQMERVGILLDTEKLAEIAVRVKTDAARLEKEIHELAGEEFMVGSPQQVGGILFEKLGLTKGRKGKTGYSTDARVLQSIRSEHPIVVLIEEWRETTKLISTYLDALPKLVDASDGRIHTTFHQAATASIPVRTDRGKEIRACFVAREGSVLVSCDYSQVELRILAHLADDQALKRIFRDGEDVHTATAAEIFGIPAGEVDGALRTKAKMVNYGIVYGLSAFGLADRLDISQSEAKEFIERYFAGFPALKTFMDGAVVEAEEKGYAQTLLGRRRPIPELKARNPQVRQLGARLAVNTVVQGTAADIMKLGMLRCAEALQAEGLEARLLLQVHDELLLEAPAAEAERVAALASKAMVDAYELDPPLVVDAGSGPDWLNAK